MTQPNSALPEGFSLYDWLELLGFTWKIESEGYEYAAENYAPSFESEALKKVANGSDPRPLKNLYRDHHQTLTDWQRAVGWEEVDRLWNAHLREEQERREAHLLWAVHPGGDWNYYAYSTAFESREDAETWIAGREAAVEKYGWQPWEGRLLHRSEPGGEWIEVHPTP